MTNDDNLPTPVPVEPTDLRKLDDSIETKGELPAVKGSFEIRWPPSVWISFFGLSTALYAFVQIMSLLVGL